MMFRLAPPFEIVRLIDLQEPGETGFCLLVNASAESPLLSEIKDELAIQMCQSLGLIDVKGQTVPRLIEQLRTSQERVVLIHGFDEWKPEQFASLDVNRSGLETGTFLLFSADLGTAGRFLDNAPNFRSFFGSNIFFTIPDPSTMSSDDIANRLTQLRSYYALSDEDVILRATARELPSDPPFLEWLVLLGRSELVH